MLDLDKYLKRKYGFRPRKRQQADPAQKADALTAYLRKKYGVIREESNNDKT